jgi:hypothetical protein
MYRRGEDHHIGGRHQLQHAIHAAVVRAHLLADRDAVQTAGAGGPQREFIAEDVLKLKGVLHLRALLAQFRAQTVEQRCGIAAQPVT